MKLYYAPGAHARRRARAVSAAARAAPSANKPPPPTTQDGAHVVKPSSFRDWISNAPGARFAPAPGRYHLYVNHGCPWAHDRAR